MFHLPGLFECIYQSGRGATAITHLVRIRERERHRKGEGRRESITEETEEMTERDSSQGGREKRGKAVGRGKKMEK